jgi:superfamily II RNA helicase
MSAGLWLSFKRHLRFLKETGFVDDYDRLTADGEWASRLRLDHPLLIAEGIRRGAFEGITKELLAAMIAPFVWDRGVDAVLRPPPGEDLEQVEAWLGKVLRAIHELRVKKTIRGFDDPEVLFWPSASLYLWARGASWEELMAAVTVDEGDIVSLITRTADHLRQVAGLSDTHPELAARAEEAVESILREPVTL